MKLSDLRVVENLRDDGTWTESSSLRRVTLADLRAVLEAEGAFEVPFPEEAGVLPPGRFLLWPIEGVPDKETPNDR